MKTCAQAHVFNILRSKFSDYKDFHTLLYTCAKEFDFLGLEMPWKITLTLLLPTTAVVTILMAFFALRDTFFAKKESRNDNKGTMEKRPFVEIDPCVAYNLLQMACYAVMAAIIMRLKLFLSPQLCIVASLICSEKVSPSRSHQDDIFVPNFLFHSKVFLFAFLLKVLEFFAKSRTVQLSLIAVLVAGMSVQGYKNIQNQRKIMGERELRLVFLPPGFLGIDETYFPPYFLLSSSDKFNQKFHTLSSLHKSFILDECQRTGGFLSRRLNYEALNLFFFSSRPCSFSAASLT